MQWSDPATRTPASSPGREPPVQPPVVVIGTSNTAVRLCEELLRAGECVRVLASGPGDAWRLGDLQRVGAEITDVPVVREEELRAAHIETAKAVVVLGQEDVVAVRIALAVEEVAPQTRLVLEMSHPEFGSQLVPLLGNCETLSSADLAAPSFVAACLADSAVQSFELAGRSLVAGSRNRVGGVLLALGNSRRTDSASLLEGDGDVVLGTHVVGGEHPTVARSGVVGALAQVFGRRLRWVLLALLGWVFLSTLYFHWSLPAVCHRPVSLRCGVSDWCNALFYAVAGAGLTEIEELPKSVAVRAPGVLLHFVGIILSALVTAVIVDEFIGARIAELAGGVRGKPRNHVVVCGLGRVGKEVAVRLARGGVPVVAIEKNDASAGVLAARRAKIPVIVAEATDRAALEQAGIGRAVSVLAITDNDAVNLETALMAHSANKDVRIITRLFDHELADRIERRLKLGPTRSVSMLAAPAFAAAALGRRRETIVSVGRRVLIFTELRVQPGSRSAGGISTVALGRRPGVLVLACRQRDQEWTWGPEPTVLRPGDRVAVVATRIGLAEVLRLIKSPSVLAAEHLLESEEQPLPPEIK